MAVPSLADWRQRILAGIKAPVTPQNVRFVNAWAQAEGGSAANNPFNTTQPMPGASSYNSVGVRNYTSPEQGIQATIQTLKGPIGNYAPILAALRQGTDPMAAAKAVAGSQWGTGTGVERVLGGASIPATTTTPTTTTPLPAASPIPAATPPPPAAAIPKMPALPAYKPVKFTDMPELSGVISRQLGRDPLQATQAIVAASGANERAIYNQMKPPLAPPVTKSTAQAQAERPPKMTMQTDEGHQVEVETRGVTQRDLQAVKLAQHFIGTPYSWGGGGPGGPSYGVNQGAHTKGFDCSGLLDFVWSRQGKNIGSNTYQQWDNGRAVPKTSLRAGDAVFFEPGASGPEHVGMYLGSGKFIEAPHTGAFVRISKLAGRGDYMGARRYG